MQMMAAPVPVFGGALRVPVPVTGPIATAQHNVSHSPGVSGFNYSYQQQLQEKTASAASEKDKEKDGAGAATEKGMALTRRNYGHNLIFNFGFGRLSNVQITVA